MKHMANLVTGCRILGSTLLLVFPAFSTGFYVIYIFCGFSDMIDGTIARKTNGASEWGAKLDTAADLAFVTVSLIKLLPLIHLPQWLWVWGGIVALFKMGNLIGGYAFQKQLVCLHTPMNKMAGLLLFLWPLTWSLVEGRYSSMAVCSVATFAAIQETVYMTANCERK